MHNDFIEWAGDMLNINPDVIKTDKILLWLYGKILTVKSVNLNDEQFHLLLIVTAKICSILDDSHMSDIYMRDLNEFTNEGKIYILNEILGGKE